MGDEDTFTVVRKDIKAMSNDEIKRELLEIEEEFPYSGGNYASEILREAADRIDKSE